HPTAATHVSTLSLHELFRSPLEWGEAVPADQVVAGEGADVDPRQVVVRLPHLVRDRASRLEHHRVPVRIGGRRRRRIVRDVVLTDRKSTRLNSSHQIISYAV